MEQKKPRRYQGGKVRQIRMDYTGIVTALILLLLITALMIGCVVARKKAANEPVVPPTEDVSSEAVSSESSESSSESSESKLEYKKMSAADLKKGDLILINREHLYNAADAEGITNVRSGRMTDIQENSWALPIGDKALQALEAMQTGMKLALQDQMVLLVNAGYRTAEDQQKLIDEYTKENGEDYVKNYVAPVGGSEHHSDLAADISFYDLAKKKVHATTSDNAAAHYSWILANSRNYGLVLRYTADKQDVTGYGPESWHFRYVGIPHATYMAENHLALEEYLEAVKEYSYGNRLTVENGENAWEIYYVALDTNADETPVPVPQTGSYEISGNNSDGFIVTVKVK